jgi:nitrite reductase (NADH) large subunit
MVRANMYVKANLCRSIGGTHFYFPGHRDNDVHTAGTWRPCGFFLWRDPEEMTGSTLLQGSGDGRASETPDVDDINLPVVVVGTGPVGMRVAQEILKREPARRLVIYGNEPWQPYNRVRLSGLLAGQYAWGSTDYDPGCLENSNVVKRYNCPVVSIDRKNRCVVDSEGVRQPYFRLVLATGSSPHIPDIPGIDLPGVFTFRDMNDVQRLQARRVRTRHTVVLGGGLLGLEAARAMQRFNTDVTVVQHSCRLMNRQLDDRGGELVREAVLGLGIHVILKDGVRKICGEECVDAIELRSGRRLKCDTLVLATGIAPNIGLARDAKLPVGRGIRVNDCMQTPDSNIYAVGECAEHNNHVYGVVAPGFEQAAVAAHHLSGGKARYRGSINTARLKVVNLPVFSMGRVGEEENPTDYRNFSYSRLFDGVYRRIVLRRSRIVGAVGVGDWPELGRLQEAINNRRIVWPWQLRKFKNTGLLWRSTNEDSVCHWPASVVVCNCTGVTRGELSQVINEGCKSVNGLMAATGASTVCGACRPLITELVGEKSLGVPDKGMSVLALSSVVALCCALLIALAPAIPNSLSVQQTVRLDVLWLDGFWKQVSGYTLLGLSVTGLLMSLRKRIKRFTAGEFVNWQLLHTIVGALGVATLILHSGFRLGENLNRYLMVDFLLIILLGSVAGALVGWQHRLRASTAKKLRGYWVWAHILAFWPLPVLLGFHITSVYFF